MDERLTVVCWLWKDHRFPHRASWNYGPQHVLALRRMVSRHLRMPHRFVCVTDRQEIGDDVETVPIWPDHAELGGCWRRLRLFASDAGGVPGERFLSIDLDCVILSEITWLVERPEDLVLLEDASPRVDYNGSMWLLRRGSRRRVWDLFRGEQSRREIRRRGLLGTDQAWLTHTVPGERTWSTRDGIYSYRWHVAGRELPSDARIVMFHGPWDPETMTQDWIRRAWD